MRFITVQTVNAKYYANLLKGGVESVVYDSHQETSEN